MNVILCSSITIMALTNPIVGYLQVLFLFSFYCSLLNCIITREFLVICFALYISTHLIKNNINGFCETKYKKPVINL